MFIQISFYDHRSSKIVRLYLNGITLTMLYIFNDSKLSVNIYGNGGYLIWDQKTTITYIEFEECYWVNQIYFCDDYHHFIHHKRNNRKSQLGLGFRYEFQVKPAACKIKLSETGQNLTRFHWFYLILKKLILFFSP